MNGLGLHKPSSGNAEEGASQTTVTLSPSSGCGLKEAAP